MIDIQSRISPINGYKSIYINQFTHRPQPRSPAKAKCGYQSLCLITWIYSRHLVSHFRIFDVPTVFLNSYEEMRRNLTILNANSIFEKVSFDENQRNVGRSAAGVQWLPNHNIDDRNQTTFVDTCISPFDQANAAPVFPASIIVACSSGMFVDSENLVNDECFSAKSA